MLSLFWNGRKVVYVELEESEVIMQASCFQAFIPVNFLYYENDI